MLSHIFHQCIIIVNVFCIVTINSLLYGEHIKPYKSLRPGNKYMKKTEQIIEILSFRSYKQYVCMIQTVAAGMGLTFKFKTWYSEELRPNLHIESRLISIILAKKKRVERQKLEPVRAMVKTDSTTTNVAGN